MRIRGARSAITLIFGIIILPFLKQPEIKIPTIKLNLSKELEIELHNKFAPKNNDIVIISRQRTMKEHLGD